ncbi:hypothetical protein [Sinorhizobium medicae]
MATDGYHREKFSSAISCLISNADLRTRLEHAFVSLVTVRPENFGDKDLGLRFARLYDRVTAKGAQSEGEGKIRSTLRQMSDEEAEEVAQEILDINTKLLLQANPDIFG